MRACVRVCVRAHMRVCVCARVCLFVKVVCDKMCVWCVGGSIS